MGRQWGPSVRAAAQAGCVVSASRAEQPEAGFWSCSGVILTRSPVLVLCHGGIFTPFLRGGSGALTSADATFLPADSCGDDLRLHVQWGPTAASSAGRAEQGRPGLCTSRCASLEPGPAAQPGGRLLEPPRAAELLLLLSCPAFRSQLARLFGSKRAEQWRFASAAPVEEVSGDEEEDQLRGLGWFALLRVQPGGEAKGEAARGLAVTVAPLGAVAKGAPLLACGSPFGAFCPDIFLNTLSRGVLSNAAGPLLLTDARCLPGTEGGGVFSARSVGALVALVAVPLCWKASEWVGLTLLCAVPPLLRAARAALTHLPDGAALAALLPPEVGAPRGLPLRDPRPPWVASAVLVEFGSVWGSGVAMAPRLVVTCRHVAPREAAKVLVHSATPKSVAIWGRVVFATQETSPYDIAVLSLEEDLDGVPMPVPAEHFQEGTAVSVVGFGVFGQACGPSVTSGILSAVVQVDDTPVMLQTTCAVHGGSSGGPLFSSPSGDLLGIVASNTRDNNTGATYPHLNFSIPITVLQPALQQYRQTGDLGGLRELDHATKPVRVVWRLQCPLPMTLRSKL
ncbi:peroxisomal leader peptide-processing protease [Heterocephalus glaber]|uniref:Peroxisomal leader peptide-processing protease n=1 Tax=Heterocephalus glaber TaxID=10181 RepID=A0AAX6P9F8_HETGA|nr:peroxisomal leader peptide-processing protease [Heterocephalus glaber]